MMTRRIALALMAAIPALGQVLVNGAGATFPYPIYSAWFSEFHRLHPDATINYQAVGSRAGIRQLQAGVLDFGASDMPLSDAESQAGGVTILHFPSVIGAVVPIYNIPGVAAELNFTPEVLAGILLGKISNWNDPRIAGTNPSVRLPDAAIVPVHRSDGSGTTFVLSEFLSKTSAEWRSEARAAPLIQWRTGIGVKGNEGVAGIVKQTPNSLGYVELAYATPNKIRFGRVRNSTGLYVRASVASVRAAANASAGAMTDDFRVSIVNAPGKDSYPMASFTWLLTPARIADAAKRRIVVEFLRWMLRDGQKSAERLGYAPLPPAVAERAMKACEKIR
jgi:phosphate transport system substrate-binding protein